jgi:hypothetical protein
MHNGKPKSHGCEQSPPAASFSDGQATRIAVAVGWLRGWRIIYRTLQEPPTCLRTSKQTDFSITKKQTDHYKTEKLAKNQSTTKQKHFFNVPHDDSII